MLHRTPLLAAAPALAGGDKNFVVMAPCHVASPPPRSPALRYSFLGLNKAKLAKDANSTDSRLAFGADNLVLVRHPPILREADALGSVLRDGIVGERVPGDHPAPLQPGEGSRDGDPLRGGPFAVGFPGDDVPCVRTGPAGLAGPHGVRRRAVGVGIVESLLPVGVGENPLLDAGKPPSHGRDSWCMRRLVSR